MTEVIISNYSKTNSPWFKFAPNTNSKLSIRKELAKKPEVEHKHFLLLTFLWIKNKLVSTIKEGDEIRPVIPLKVRKTKAYSEIGASAGILFSSFKIL